MFDDIDMDLGLPSWASDMRKSMDEMHKRMIGWMKNGFSDDKLFSGDLKNDMSKWIKLKVEQNISHLLLNKDHHTQTNTHILTPIKRFYEVALSSKKVFLLLATNVAVKSLVVNSIV